MNLFFFLHEALLLRFLLKICQTPNKTAGEMKARYTIAFIHEQKSHKVQTSNSEMIAKHANIFEDMHNYFRAFFGTRGKFDSVF